MTVQELINELKQSKDLNKEVWLSVDMNDGPYQVFKMTSVDDDFADGLLFIQNHDNPFPHNNT